MESKKWTEHDDIGLDGGNIDSNELCEIFGDVDDEEYATLDTVQGFQGETELGFPEGWKESRGRARDGYRNDFPGALDGNKAFRGK